METGYVLFRFTRRVVLRCSELERLPSESLLFTHWDNPTGRETYSIAFVEPRHTAADLEALAPQRLHRTHRRRRRLRERAGAGARGDAT